MARARACLLCVAFVTLAAAAPATAKTPSIALRLAQPTPGHITVAVHTLTVPGRHRKAPRLAPQKLRSMPRSVRVLYARRVIRKARSTTFAMVLIAVNAAAPAAQSADNDDEAGHLISGGKVRKLTEAETVLLFMGGPVSLPALFEDDQRQEDAAERAVQVTQADALSDAAAKARAGALVKSVVDPNGDGKADSGLDTGHYDDGHAFGWAIKSKADEKKTWAELTKESLDQYILQLEDSFKYDIDGDGTIESPSKGGDGQQIDTQVGGPVVTGGGS